MPPMRNSGTSEPTWAAISSLPLGQQTPCVRLGALSARAGPADSLTADPLTCYSKFFFQPHQRRNRVARTGAQPALHRKPLVDMNFDLARLRQAPPRPARTIFQAVLLLSVGTRLSFEVSRSAVAGAGRAVTVTTSCISSVW